MESNIFLFDLNISPKKEVTDNSRIPSIVIFLGSILNERIEVEVIEITGKQKSGHLKFSFITSQRLDVAKERWEKFLKEMIPENVSWVLYPTLTPIIKEDP